MSNISKEHLEYRKLFSKIAAIALLIAVIPIWPYVFYQILKLVVFGAAAFSIYLYHNLLYWKILPESIAPCTLGISCTTKFFEWFGFVTIPFMALLAFIIINALIFMSYKKSTYEKS
jgi:disulfide bond formation protein DsbB